MIKAIYQKLIHTIKFKTFSFRKLKTLASKFHYTLSESTAFYEVFCIKTYIL